MKLATGQLLDDLLDHISHASTIYIMTSFVMKSGIEQLFQSLEAAALRGADIKILTGDYLYVTQPEALKQLVGLPSDQVEIRLWQSNGRSFHPKAYLFKYEEQGTLIVGSSNMSKSALRDGVEWNLSMPRHVSEEVYDEALEEFIHLFQNENTMIINKETIQKYEERYIAFRQRHPDLAQTWTKQEELNLTFGEPETMEGTTEVIEESKGEYHFRPEPRFAQPDALEALVETQEEGYDKAMVVMATGLGKTYLAAFFAEQFERVLFVAHREEILYQGQKSFGHVSPEKSSGIYNGRVKEEENDFVFASIFTLSIQENLHSFSPDDFDLIIIDEFHHAAAKSYQRVLDYFNPAFLLGITATPERTDGQDIFAICDGNVAYEMDFIQAIQRGWLSPFRYYGVYDDIDYSQVTWLGTRYDQEELLAAQLQEEVAEKVLIGWKEHSQTRTIGFCSSVIQAEFLAQYFRDKGYQAQAIHGKTDHFTRTNVIGQLESREIDIIFTVDLFNEGVDIPSVDTLLFARPTESLVVYTQQVGRGLRLTEGKTHCHIIDLIGNYRNADNKLALFDVTHSEKKKKGELLPVVPASCELNLDTRAIDLIEEIRKKASPRKEQLRMAYQKVKEMLGRRPTYLELHLRSDINAKEYKRIFRSYFGFLKWADELSEEEIRVYERYQDWLEEVERTAMSKSYKMVVLELMLNRGVELFDQPLQAEGIAYDFHQFFMSKRYRRDTDFSTKKAKALWDYKEEKVVKLIEEMPFTKWAGSSKGLVEFDGDVFSVAMDVDEIDKEVLYQLTKEICEYRLEHYFEKKAR
ncbi:Superfamily II DNA or RNA helicase [Thalassobacillus cyri]|uniref:Superfamily II DNA or RNA helicase n=1 Tax=Thalassobacillus cyri TaxID=571932 RepID=A0A1H3VZ53_9BACI|nr:DEAD/DEAH box helicase family protein [Thalassobacillus cyri]SDZ79961.1 Superfamily II DNA or RNA helicase [Thalassobacillus cyri]